MEKEKIDLTELYKKQISLTEWFENIKHSSTEKFRAEDNVKRETLKILNEIIGLPFDKPYQFKALDIVNMTADFGKFLDEHGHELCALRLIPIDSSLPKLRMRGHIVKDVVNGWFKEQKIDYSKYRADFVPHPTDHIFSSIFIVNKKGIFGEIIKGSHNQLTQGFHDEGKPVSFSYDFNEWKFSEKDDKISEHAKKITDMIKVDESKKEEIVSKIEGEFNREYLVGYFEAVESKEFGLWFIDYNKTLAKMYSDFMPVVEKKAEGNFLTGQPASLGKVLGRIKIVNPEDLGKVELENEILVCDVTTPDYFLLMQKSLGIITNGGGMLSHAGIVARELGKPCIVGTGNATEVLKNGDLVELDADRGVVRKL